MTVLRSVAFSLLLVTDLSVAAPPSAPATSDTIAVAGLLGGHVLVPLAQLSGGRWSRTWPGPDDRLEIPVRVLKDVPKAWYPKGRVPTTWFLFTEHLLGAPVSVSAPILADAHCQRVWGLRTVLQPSGHETTAFAVSRQTGVVPFEESTVDPAFETTLAPFLAAAFEKAVAAAPPSSPAGSAPAAPAPPAQAPSVHVACAVIDENAHTLCHFAASRALHSSANTDISDCSTIAVVQGWYSFTEYGLVLLSSDLTATDCDAVELRSTFPHLLFSVGSRSFVIVREHGYEDESFAILELTKSGLTRLLDIPGGGC